MRRDRELSHFASLLPGCFHTRSAQWQLPPQQPVLSSLQSPFAATDNAQVDQATDVSLLLTVVQLPGATEEASSTP